jgi:hypothetical protein
MATKVWTVAFESAHTVELHHGAKTGSRNILIDGKPIELGPQSKKLLDAGSVHQFEIDGRPVEIHIEPVGLGRWYYRLKADDQWLDEPLPPSTVPAWTFVFVGLACLPTLQLLRGGTTPLGLVLCGSMALGASIGIIASARDPLMALDRKVIKCGLLTALVWGVLAVPSLMLIGASKLLNG